MSDSADISVEDIPATEAAKVAINLWKECAVKCLERKSKKEGGELKSGETGATGVGK